MSRIIFAALILFSLSSQAESLVTSDFSKVESGIDQFVTSLTPDPKKRNVLLAFDYDDTVLSPVSVIGSEAWFTWQEGLLKGEPSKDRLVENFDGLLTLQNRLLGLIRFKPTEAKIPEVLKNLQSKGYGVIICTSRGFNDYTATERELAANGISFAESNFSKSNHSYSPFVPYDLKNPKGAGFTEKETKDWKLETPRPVAFINGIFLTDGQNKGVMLRSLLNRSKQKVNGLVFVDNRRKHTDRVEKGFATQKGVKVYTVLYNRVDIDSKPIAEQAEKVEQARNEWTKLQDFVN